MTAEKMLQRAALLLATLVFIVPFLQTTHRMPQATFDMEWLSALLLSATALALAFLRVPKMAVGLALPAWLAAMLGVVAIQYSLGRLQYPSQFALAAVYAAAIAGAYLVGRALLAADLRQRAMTWIAGGLVLAALFSVAIQWLQLGDVHSPFAWTETFYFEVDDAWMRTRPFANTAQANHLATFLAWGIFAALYLAGRGIRPGHAGAALFAIAMGLAMTRSRMGVFFVFAAVLACWLPSALRASTPASRKLLSAAVVLGYLVGVGAMTLIVSYQGAGVDSALGRFNESGAFSIRWRFWTDAVIVAQTSPWIGVGFDQYAYGQYWAVPLDGPHVSTQNVHNMFLQTAAELGWPLAILLVLMAGWWATAQFRQRMQDRETVFAWALLAAVAFHAGLEFPLSMLHFSVPAAMLFAMGEPELRRRFAASRVSLRLLAPGALVGLALCTTMKMEFDEISWVFYAAEVERKSPTGVSDETLRRMLALSETALLRIYPDMLFVTLRTPERVEATDDEIERHRRTMVRAVGPRVITRLVILEARAGRVEAAKAHIDRLAVFNPVEYPDMSKIIRSSLASMGADAAPVLERLASAAPRPQPASLGAAATTTRAQ